MISYPFHLPEINVNKEINKIIEAEQPKTEYNSSISYVTSNKPISNTLALCATDGHCWIVPGSGQGAP